jgi:RimJ/RimL family protein N-acetyltransferase
MATGSEKRRAADARNRCGLPASVSPVRELAELSTDRLRLAPVAVNDAESLFVIMSDPAGWWYQPDGRHAGLETTIAFCRWVEAMWSADGLSYWTARDLTSEEVVGIGGSRRHRDLTWNLSYRIATGHQGRGLAVELGKAARNAAAIIDHSVALIAWVDDHNTPSRRVAERIGLTSQGTRIDPGDGQLRLAYSDRPLD